MDYGGKKLFNDVNFSLKPNNRYGLIGANGSGKSTLIRLIQGEEELTSGDIIINDLLKVSALSQDQFKYENGFLIFFLVNQYSLRPFVL